MHSQPERPGQAARLVPLHRIAHSRAGDKGNRLNLSLFAYHPRYYGILVEQVTEARLLDLFRYRHATSVVRYLLPRLCGMNFVIDGALQGGVNGSLNLDGHGKTLSYRLLAMEVDLSPLHAHDVAE